MGAQVMTGELELAPGPLPTAGTTRCARLENGSPLNLRMTRAVQDALFGPPLLGTPERQRREAARELAETD